MNDEMFCGNCKCELPEGKSSHETTYDALLCDDCFEHGKWLVR